MRSLFLKIFVCFWFSHIIAVFVVLALTVAVPPPGGRAGDDIPTTDFMTATARDAAARFRLGGTTAVAGYLQKLESARRMRLLLFNAHGRELTGHSAVAGAATLAVRGAAASDIEASMQGGELLLATRTTGPGSNTFVLVAQVRRGDRLTTARWGRRQLFTVMRLIAAFLAAGVVAWGLALYLTAPTVKLRHATQQLAGGDLSTRVGPHMGRRRDELADLAHDFDRMAERIELLVLSERRLLADISHELRSPLARLQVALDLAQETADSETGEFLRRIGREAERLNQLIGQLLTLARLETSGAEGAGAAVPLAPLLAEVVADADFEAGARSRSVGVVHTEDITTRGNPELLRSAVENVVRNAVCYTAEGTRVEVSLQREPTTREGVHWAVISVRDHGPGVPSEALEHLFRPFYRVANARDRQSGGVGLGLSITLRAVALHGGEVSATNLEEGGLLVRIRLPRL